MRKASLVIIIFSLQFSLFAQNQKPPAVTDPVREAVLNNTCNALNSYYVYPDKAKLMADHLKQQGEKGSYDSLTDPNDLAARIVRDLRFVYNDKHLRVEYNPSLEKDILKFLSSKKDAGVISAADIAKDEKKN